LRDESEAPDDDDEGQRLAHCCARPSPANALRTGLSAAPSRRRRTHAGAPADKKFQTLILGLHQQIHQHKCGAIFHHPIKPSDAPDYPLLIHRPVDLKTIKARVRSGEISNSVEYRRDIALMFANAMMFNRPSSDVYKMAEEVLCPSHQVGSR
jgi:bromodomain-containing protein 8